MLGPTRRCPSNAAWCRTLLFGCLGLLAHRPDPKTSTALEGVREAVQHWRGAPDASHLGWSLGVVKLVRIFSTGGDGQDNTLNIWGRAARAGRGASFKYSLVDKISARMKNSWAGRRLLEWTRSLWGPW